MPPVLESLIERLGGQRRAMLVGVGVAAALLIFGLSRWATAPTWVPLFTGLPLETVGDVTQRLDDEGVPFRLERGGAEVLVPASDVARARVRLAKDGLPSAGRPGLELFDQPSWGMTDFSQRINYRRALEGELERTIGKMRGVENAQVHLAMQETSGFRAANRAAEASVVLRLRNGATPTPDVVQGIAHLVASSVDGLTSDKVSVLDDTGRLLSTPAETGPLAALNNRQLALQREVEAHLEGKAESLLAQIVGGGNSRVQVAATINFDRLDRTMQTVDPDRQVLATEQRAEIVPGPEGGAGSTNTSATYENSRLLETYSAALGTVRRISVAVLVNERQVLGADGAVTFQPRTADELSRIEALVRSAVGVDEQRGDLVSVVSVPFDGSGIAVVDEAPTDIWGLVYTFHRPFISLVALLLAFLIALKVIRSLQPQPAAEPVPALGAGEGGTAAGALGDGGEAESEAAPALAGVGARTIPLPKSEPTIQLPSMTSPLRDQVAASVEERPEVAARLVRAWMKDY
jgi:flagellar M-ring protein FliF